MFNNLKFLIVPILLLSNIAFAQSETANDVEEVVVVGSQIKGAKITGALAVNVISTDEIDSLGINSGEDLVAALPEQGQNTYNQVDWSGGYNANRGDVGSFNLRNIGTGNTLTLINGRRVVNAPGYKTESISGSFIPVLSVNSNEIPVMGLDRLEVLRDGASAIYGADAVTGVVNTVLKKDYEGSALRYRVTAYDHFAAENHSLNFTWGKNFGSTNVSFYFDYLDQGKIKSTEDPRWASMDYRDYLSAADVAYNDTTWRNTSSSSVYGTFWAGLGTNVFAMYDAADSNCAKNTSADYYAINGIDHVCLYDSSTTRESQYANYNLTRDARGELERLNAFLYINFELGNGIEGYTEFSIYNSDNTKDVFGSNPLGSSTSSSSAPPAGQATQPIFIPCTNYYLANLVSGTGKSWCGTEKAGSVYADGMYLRSFRTDDPRGYDSYRETYRLLQGFTGNLGDWFWDTAILYSEAKSNMQNYGRVSLTLLDQALADPNPSAFNPFCAGIECNLDQALVTIYRKNVSKLTLADFKISNPNAFNFELPGGPIGALFGAEIRKESLDDMRDPRINGGIRWTGGAGFPYVTDIMQSSPSPNTYGERTTTSLFGELQLPIMTRMNAQLALRYEDADDFGDTTVGKFAIGWQITDWAKVRGSSSSSFRAPNLVIVNEGQIARSNTLSDPVGCVGYDVQTCSYSIQRIAQGNPNLAAEDSDNTSLGVVLEPIDGLVITYDMWKIEQEGTVGLFGETNHMLLDLLMRLQGGASECTGNPVVVRFPYVDDPENPWAASNLCPAGAVQRVEDTYINLDKRTVEGTDAILDYGIDTDFGKFKFKFVWTHYDKFFQEASGPTLEIIEASQSGGPLDLPNVVAPRGFDDLLGINGAFEDKYSLNLSWRNGPYEVLVSGTMIGDFKETAVSNDAYTGSGSNRTYYCSGLTGSTASAYTGQPGCGEYWTIDSMTTLNLTIGYQFKNGLRIRGTVTNVEDERAPLADEEYGFWPDVHSDYGRYYRLELYKKF